MEQKKELLQKWAKQATEAQQNFEQLAADMLIEMLPHVGKLERDEVIEIKNLFIANPRNTPDKASAMFDKVISCVVKDNWINGLKNRITTCDDYDTLMSTAKAVAAEMETHWGQLTQNDVLTVWGLVSNHEHNPRKNGYDYFKEMARNIGSMKELFSVVPRP